MSSTNTIMQLFRGQLEPKSFLGNGNGEMRRTENLMDTNFNKLKEKLDEDERKILEKYSCLIDEYIFLISEQAFCDGFCLGVKISAEAIVGAERIL